MPQLGTPFPLRPQILEAIVLTAALAALMSTLDSQLLTLSSMFIRDLSEPLVRWPAPPWVGKTVCGWSCPGGPCYRLEASGHFHGDRHRGLHRPCGPVPHCDGCRPPATGHAGGGDRLDHRGGGPGGGLPLPAPPQLWDPPGGPDRGCGESHAGGREPPHPAKKAPPRGKEKACKMGLGPGLRAPLRRRERLLGLGRRAAWSPGLPVVGLVLPRTVRSFGPGLLGFLPGSPHHKRLPLDLAHEPRQGQASQFL
ncbi:TPA: hypothetical protein EYH33_03720 [Candidatus Bipolaricaulota bacterium]|nr:hypothetical protein [Candidatus Bipolaricaulota bacterium]